MRDFSIPPTGTWVSWLIWLCALQNKIRGGIKVLVVQHKYPTIIVNRKSAVNFIRKTRALTRSKQTSQPITHTLGKPHSGHRALPPGKELFFLFLLSYCLFLPFINFSFDFLAQKATQSRLKQARGERARANACPLLCFAALLLLLFLGRLRSGWRAFIIS